MPILSPVNALLESVEDLEGIEIYKNVPEARVDFENAAYEADRAPTGLPLIFGNT